MDKLIIHHGDRVTEHEIGEHPLLLGRDPQCDLFFADKKLSRRHARFEREGKHLRLVDLGSRNGSWVNDERVETQLVAAGDSMRLGSLVISLLTESEPEEDSTVYLTAEPAGADESGTVMLSSESLSAAAPGGPEHDANKVVEPAGADESGTVMLSSEALSAAAPGGPEHDANEVVEPAGADESGTVMLSSEALSAAAPGGPEHDANEVVEPAVADESGTVMLSSEGLSVAASSSPNEPVEDGRTAMLPTTDTLRPPENEDEPDESGEEDVPTLYRPDSDGTVVLESATPFNDAKTGEVIIRGEVDPSLKAATRIVSPESPPARSSSGSLRFVALVAAISVLAVAVLALPLMLTLGGALTYESALRARALVDLLAATNVAALSQSPPEEGSLERVIDEPGVVAAYVLDWSGNILAPDGGDAASLPKDALEDAAGLRALLTRDLVNGDVLIMTPIQGDGRPVGVAVLQVRHATVSGWSTVMLVLGALLLLMGIGAAVLLARRAGRSARCGNCAMMSWRCVKAFLGHSRKSALTRS